MAKKNKKIVKYRKPVNINIGIIIFAFLFVYLLIITVLYVTKDKIHIYEVREGTLTQDVDYTALVLRDEEIRSAGQAGTVNYYMREGEKAGVGDLVYSIDESGEATEQLAQNSEDENKLSEENLNYLKKQLLSFNLNYDGMNFDQLYDIKYSLQSLMWDYISVSAMDELGEILNDESNFFQLNYADISGMILYQVDGYEGLDVSQITKNYFDESQYSRTYLTPGKMVAPEDPVYKIVKNDNWSLIIPITKEDVLAFADQTTATVRFAGEDEELTGAYSTFIGADGETYARVDFTKYIDKVLSERFVDIELCRDQTEGLKIPVSSIVQKDFYTIPVEYLTTGGNEDEKGFLKEVYSETGEKSVEFVSPTIYETTDEYYYVDPSAFDAGTNLVKPDSDEHYQITAKAPLTGVYNVNKGYAVFRKVEILEQNSEYCIVSEDTQYGISVYDHIVLDGSKVTENDIIY